MTSTAMCLVLPQNLILVIAFCMNSLHSAVPSFLLISGTCVAYFTVLMLVGKGKKSGKEMVQFASAGLFIIFKDSGLVKYC